MGYKYYIDQKNKQYYFGLYPNNNNHQSIGLSGLFDSEQSAIEGIHNFRLLIDSTENILELFDVITIPKDELFRYKFVLKDNKYNISFYRCKLFGSKYQAKEALRRIANNINAPIKYR